MILGRVDGNRVAERIATLDLVSQQYVDDAARTGPYFMVALERLAKDFPCIGEVRGKGLMIGMELIVLDAERTQLSSQDAFADARTRTATALVGLYRALAGGWPTRVPERVQVSAR